MSHRRGRRRIVTAAVLSALGIFGIVTACSNYGEGQRCQPANFNDDCENGLTCTLAAQLDPPFRSSDRCCPSDRSQATTAECRQTATGIGNQPPTEGGSAEASIDASEASVPEASTDADADASDAADADEDADN